MAGKIKYDVNNIDVKKIIQQLDSIDYFSNFDPSLDMFSYEIEPDKKVSNPSDDLPEFQLMNSLRTIEFDGHIDRNRGPIGYIKYISKKIVRKTTHKYFEELARKQSDFNDAVYDYLVKEYNKSKGSKNE